MSDQRRSRHSIFGGLVLVLIGTLFLIQNFHPELDLWNLLFRWWPLLLILLGVARLIDYLLAHNAAPDGPAPRVVSGGDVFLIIAILALVAVAGGVNKVRQRLGDADFWSAKWGNPYVFTEQVSSPQPVPANARIAVSDVNGDISVHAEDRAEILVTVKKTINEFKQSDAQSRADAIHFTIVDNHDGSFDISPQQQGSDSRRMQTDLDIHVPQRRSRATSTSRAWPARWKRSRTKAISTFATPAATSPPQPITATCASRESRATCSFPARAMKSRSLACRAKSRSMANITGRFTFRKSRRARI
jgi:hypothetical protein